MRNSRRLQDIPPGWKCCSARAPRREASHHYIPCPGFGEKIHQVAFRGDLERTLFFWGTFYRGIHLESHVIKVAGGRRARRAGQSAFRAPLLPQERCEAEWLLPSVPWGLRVPFACIYNRAPSRLSSPQLKVAGLSPAAVVKTKFFGSLLLSSDSPNRSSSIESGRKWQSGQCTHSSLRCWVSTSGCGASAVGRLQEGK